MGFFSASAAISDRPAGLIPKCGACGLLKTCNSPLMPVAGEGRLRVMLVGEAPGEDEDRENLPFVGKSGRHLRDTLSDIGVDMDRDCWRTNALVCRPPINATPTEDQIEWCRPNVLRAIRELDPVCVVLLGGAAIKSLIGYYWRSSPGAVARWVGWTIPLQEANVWLCPTYHPSFVMRTENNKNHEAVKLWFCRHLEVAFTKLSKPWRQVPDYASRIKIEMDPNRAADQVNRMVATGDPLAWDLETDRLKPDAPDAQIVSAAVCRKGAETVAYPFVGAAVTATRNLCGSASPKIGANTKFEDRWVRSKLGVRVNNWIWDTVLSAHHLDNRKDITSVKFQAFVRLGAALWNTRIESYLQANDSVSPNNIRQVDLKDLLLYNGLDALIEYLIAVDQRNEMREQNR